MNEREKRADAAFDALLARTLAPLSATPPAAEPTAGFEARTMAFINRAESNFGDSGANARGFPAGRPAASFGRRLGFCFMAGAAVLSVVLTLPPAGPAVRAAPRAAEKLLREDFRHFVLGAMAAGADTARGLLRVELSN